jgi:hypothetical protein
VLPRWEGADEPASEVQSRCSLSNLIRYGSEGQLSRNLNNHDAESALRRLNAARLGLSESFGFYRYQTHGNCDGHGYHWVPGITES